MADAKDWRNTYHAIAIGQAALPVDSMGNPWMGANVFSSGNLKLDLLHNFFLECGARANKMRVYEMTSDPTAREVIGYLLVRGGLHVVAYTCALEYLTGVELTKLVPVPDLSNKPFKETKKYTDAGLYHKLYTFSDEDFGRVAEIFNGPHPEDGKPLTVEMGGIEGPKPPDLEEEPQLNAPGAEDYDPEMFAAIAKKMGVKM